MRDKTTSLIVTAAIAVCLVAVTIAVAVLLVAQHAVPAVALGLVTTLAALIVPSPLGHNSGGVSDAVQAVLTGAGAAAALPPPAPVGQAPTIDLTVPEAPAAPAAATPANPVPPQAPPTP